MDGIDPIDAIADLMFRSITDVAAERVEIVRQQLSVPVQYVGAREGDTIHPTAEDEVNRYYAIRKGKTVSGKIIRSRPGEPPRKESGRLQASIQSASETDGDKITAEVSSDAEYAPRLDPEMQRIIFTGAADEDAPKIIDRLNAGIDQLNGAT